MSIVPYFTARPIWTFPTFCGTVSALSTFFFWNSATVQIENSLKLKMVELGKGRKIAAVVLSSMIASLDGVISVMSVFGRISGNTLALVPAVAFIVFNTATAVSILLVRVGFQC